jgi:hypothetical protein
VSIVEGRGFSSPICGLRTSLLEPFLFDDKGARRLILRKASKTFRMGGALE